MRMRFKPYAGPELDACYFYVKNPEETCGNWASVFPNKAPFWLEFGCGKGGFAGKLGLLNPNVNCLAVDITQKVLIVAKRNIAGHYKTEDKEVDNLRIADFNVTHLEKYISKEDKPERIFINFCNPWPKDRHHKRRLVHPRFLVKYREILAPNGTLHFKTDSDELFNDAVEYFKECNWAIDFITYDLHSCTDRENIPTEHENMFSQQGIKIKALVARPI